MAKIPFTLEVWLKDKSQRVETRDGRIVHNIWPVKEPLFVHGKKTEVCALIDGEEEVLLFFAEGKYLPVDSENPFDLFIVTPKEEPNEIEKRLVKFYNKRSCLQPDKDGVYNRHDLDELLHITTAELISLAMDARAKELSEGLKQSKIDKDSISYHLIEFMCNLYDCQNWKKIEEIAELYVTRIKAAAMKDLPRWVRDDSIKAEQYITVGKNGERFHYKGHSLLISDLTKLPGFKED